MAKPLLVMRLVNLTINFDIMLYLIESGIYAKIGYTSDNKTLEKRLSSYQTHNPSLGYQIQQKVARKMKRDCKLFIRTIKQILIQNGAILRNWLLKSGWFTELLQKMQITIQSSEQDKIILQSMVKQKIEAIYLKP